MKDEKLISSVNELNEELSNKKEEELYFSFSTNGYVQIIEFMNECIWNSEMDDRLWIEENKEHEPMLPYLKEKFNKYVEKLNKIKFEK